MTQMHSALGLQQGTQVAMRPTSHLSLVRVCNTSGHQLISRSLRVQLASTGHHLPEKLFMHHTPKRVQMRG